MEFNIIKYWFITNDLAKLVANSYHKGAFSCLSKEDLNKELQNKAKSIFDQHFQHRWYGSLFKDSRISAIKSSLKDCILLDNQHVEYREGLIFGKKISKLPEKRAPSDLNIESSKNATTEVSVNSKIKTPTPEDIRWHLAQFSAEEVNFLCKWIKSLTYTATADQIIMREQPNRPMDEMKKTSILKLLDLIKQENRSAIYKLSADAPLDPTVLAGLTKEQKTLFSIVQTL